MRWPRVDVHRASVDMRSREFERWQSHLISSRKVLPDANSRWPGGSSTAARPRAASRSWSESPLAARAEHKRSYTLLSVHSACRAGLPAADGHTCAPLNVASLGGVAAAQGWRIRVPPPLSSCVKEMFTPAAQPRLRKFWWQRGQDDFVARSLRFMRSRAANQCLDFRVDHDWLRGAPPW